MLFPRLGGGVILFLFTMCVNMRAVPMKARKGIRFATAGVEG